MPVLTLLETVDGKIDQIIEMGNALVLEAEHESCIFPEDTGETVTLTGAAAANAWTAWAEMVDNTGETFSSKLAVCEGHISAIIIETVSVNSQRYLIEVAYGAAYTNVARARIYSGNVPKQEARIRSVQIPAGETVYYRMRCSQAGSPTCTIHLRYHCDT